MGERKGTNHYYPPDYDPKKGGLNKFMGTHPLRERARKIQDDILIIRFELPFNIWCNGCGNHIGMGVRYNAEKKKIGNYFTIPIWSFRMKCHLCQNYFEIKTEPKTHEYIILSGARRQENRWDAKQNGQIVPEDKNITKKIYDNAMFKLEHGCNDRNNGDRLKDILISLQEKRKALFMDDYEANSIVRKKFRKIKGEEEIHSKCEVKEEKRVKRKTDILKDIYDNYRIKHTFDLIQKTQVSSSIVKCVRPNPQHQDSEMKNFAFCREDPGQVSLVSNAYDSSTSEDDMNSDVNM